MMVSAALKLVGLDLQRSWLRLKLEAETFKDRTTGEFKRVAVNAGLAVAFALAGLFFFLLTIVTGLVALYRWVAIEYGPFAGLGAVAALTAVFAIVLFLLAVSRAKSAKPEMPPMPDLKAVTAPVTDTVLSPATYMEAAKQELTEQASDAAGAAMRTASDAVRTSSRETLVATLAAAVVAGILIGRRRGASR
jgi:hypothetical protein